MSQGDGRFPKRLRVQTAYQIRRGNPLTRYDPLDFSLESGDFVINHDECTLDRVELNEIVLDVERAGANITVTGFDPNRDLLVQVDEIGGGM